MYPLELFAFFSKLSLKKPEFLSLQLKIVVPNPVINERASYSRNSGAALGE